MNTRPKAQPPSTMCHSKGTFISGFVAEFMALSNCTISNEPTAPDTMMRHEPIPVATKTSAPMRQASVDVSPIEPGTKPRNACIQLTLPPASASGPVSAASASQVAPLLPSTVVSAAIQTWSPEICAG